MSAGYLEGGVGRVNTRKDLYLVKTFCPGFTKFYGMSGFEVFSEESNEYYVICLGYSGAEEIIRGVLKENESIVSISLHASNVSESFDFIFKKK